MTNVSHLRTRGMCFLAASCLVTALAAAPARAGLVSYWDFNDGTGSSTATDVVGGRTGNLVNMASGSDWVTGHTGGAGDYALTFDGSNERVEVPTYKGQAGRSARTMSAWVNADLTNKVILSWGKNEAGQKWVFRTNSQNGDPDTLRVEVNGGFQVGSTDIVGTGWQHVVATWENDGSPNVGDVKLYVGGSLETNSSTNTNGINTNTSQNFWIGGESFGSRYFDGEIDDVAVWNRVLTATEIASLAAGTAPTAIPTVAPNAALHYDAAQDTSPTNGSWEDLTNLTGGHDWSINNNGGGARHVDAGDPVFLGVTKAYTFNGTSDTATTATFDSFSGNPTNDSASFEILFKPSDLFGQEILFETGGTGNGMSFAIDGNDVLFTASSASAATTGQVVFDGLTTDYLHAVGIIERTGGGADVSLYVNGTFVNSVSLNGFADWAGTDNSGLGQVNGTTGGNNTGLLNGFGKFSGEIALFRFYDTVLTPEDVRVRYTTLALPEPMTMLAVGLSVAGLGGYIRRRRRA